MKREDMLASLRGYLIDYKRDHPNIKFNADDLARFVLDCVERQGMNPVDFYDGGFGIVEWENEE